MLTAVIFALVHNHNQGDNVQLLTVGLLSGWAYCQTRNLVAPILVHAAFNGGVLAFFAWWVSGG